MKKFFPNNKNRRTVIVISALVLLISAFFIWLHISNSLNKKRLIDRTSDFGLRIDKISINVPVVANVDPLDESSYQKALYGGVAQAKDSSVPGRGGNIFIFGHSGSVDAKHPYGQILSKLNELKIGDQVIVYYQKKEYKYSVTKSTLYAPEDLSALQPTTKERLTIMTCWPPGTLDKRMIIFAEPQ
jgi:sortase A